MKIQPKQINKAINDKLISGGSFSPTLNNQDDITSLINSTISFYNLNNKVSNNINEDGFLLENIKLIKAHTLTSFNTNRGEEIFGELEKVGLNWNIKYYYYSFTTFAKEIFTFDFFPGNCYLLFQYRNLFNNNVNRDYITELYNKQNKKIIYEVDNIQNINIPYQYEIFGKLPIIQYWSTTTKQLEIIQAELDDINEPSNITIDFGYNATGFVVIS